MNCVVCGKPTGLNAHGKPRKTCSDKCHRIPAVTKIAQAKRARTHCVHGHPFAGSNLKWDYTGGVWLRRCRACENRRQREEAARERAKRAETRELAKRAVEKLRADGLSDADIARLSGGAQSTVWRIRTMAKACRHDTCMRVIRLAWPEVFS